VIGLFKVRCEQIERLTAEGLGVALGQLSVFGHTRTTFGHAHKFASKSASAGTQAILSLFSDQRVVSLSKRLDRLWPSNCIDFLLRRGI
jgi:hypothetical protein